MAERTVLFVPATGRSGTGLPNTLPGRRFDYGVTSFR